MLFSDKEMHTIRGGYALRVVLTLVILSFIVLGVFSRISKSDNEQTLTVLQSILEETPQASFETFVSEIYTQDQTIEKWGFLVSPLTESLREMYSIPDGINGVVFLQVEAGGVAEKSGFLPGDLLTAINQKPIDDIQTFLQAFTNTEQGVLVEIYRNQNFKYLSIGSSSLGIPKAL